MFDRNIVELAARTVYIETKESRLHYRTFTKKFVESMMGSYFKDFPNISAEAEIIMFVDYAEGGYGFGTNGFFNNLSFNLEKYYNKQLVS